MSNKTKKYIYIQPEYVKQFKCDGSKCDAKCCSQGWNITVDSETYRKYAGIKPKSKARQIIERIEFKKQFNLNVMKLQPDGRCPFLRQDKLCSIQRRYGEGFLSETCRVYPRVAYNLINFYERALTITCPLVAELILSPPEPMAFEQVELDEYQHLGNGTIDIPNLPRGLLEQAFTVQYAAISILQSRNLSIDGRLIVLGFYLDRLDELIKDARLDEIEKLSAVYSSEEFLSSEAPHLINGIQFDCKAYIKTMFKLLDSLYGDGAKFNQGNNRYIDAVSDALEIAVDKNKGASLSELVKNYEQLDSARKEFLDRHSIELEHYLVNEFFLSLYPWKLSTSISQNYGAFVAAYKILELIGLSIEVQWKKWHADDSEPPKDYQLPAIITNLAVNVDHSREYLQCMTDHLEGDILSIMKGLL